MLLLQMVFLINLVPGPNKIVPFANCPIDEIIAIIPQSSPSTLGCGLYTYHEHVTVSIVTDFIENDLVYGKDASKEICLGFERSLTKMLELVEIDKSY